MIDTHSITSLQNTQVKIWRALKESKGRAAHGLFLAEGEHMAGEALATGKATALLMDTDGASRYNAYRARALAQGIAVYDLAAHVFSAVCDAKTPQGVAAVCALPAARALPVNCARIAALDGVQDPGNVGTILRTLDAAGFDGLLMESRTADPFSPKALRASMGAIFRVPIARADDLPAALRALSATHDLYAGALDGAPFFARTREKAGVCVIIGNEGAGISPAVYAVPGIQSVKLPMVGGAESLNAAVAAGVMVYDIVRRGE